MEAGHPEPTKKRMSDRERRRPLLMLSLAALAVEASAGEAARYTFDLPSQPLSASLNSVALTSGAKLVYADTTVKDRRAASLQGSYTVNEALNRLLAANGLHAEPVGGAVFAVKDAAPVPSNALPKVTVTGKAETAVDDPYNPDYTRPDASTATKTDTPLMETPASIEIVPRQVIQDQKSTRIKDALENVSGVRPQPSLGTGTNFIIRGFQNGFRIYRNGLGLINGFGGLQSEVDTANVESIEVLKGPASILYGRIEPGGLINITTKAPLTAPYYALEQRFGSYDFYRTEWDATGPILGDRSLLYRFSGAYQSNNSFRDFGFNDRVLVNPTLTWRPTDATELTINVEGLDHEFKADYGIPAIGKRPAPIPISRSLDDPNTPRAHDSHVYLNTGLVHRFNDDWTVRNRFLAIYEENDSTFVNPVPAFGDALQADNRTLNRNIFSQEASTEAYVTNLDLIGKFEFWQTRHEVLLGYDYTRSFSRYGNFGDYNSPNPALAIDIFNPAPSYGIPRSLFESTLATAAGDPNNLSEAKLEWNGVYFQDQITLWDRLHILGGGRYDWVEKGRGYGPTYDAAEKAIAPTIRKDEQFSPRVGILYQPWDVLSIYGNWSNSFGANNGVNAAGQAQPPEIGEQFEVGVKADLFDQRLNATLAFYHLTKQNLLTPDLSTPQLLDSIAIGEARSQGIELDLTGRVTESLNLIASYAYTDARVTHDNSGLQGNRLSNIPEHAGSLWLKYDLVDFAPLDGLSLGIGTFLAGQREGDPANTFQLPGYVRLDAFAAYRFQVGKSRLTAQLNIRNLLDKRYYESTDPDSNVAPRLGIYPGAPLSFVGSLRLEY